MVAVREIVEAVREVVGDGPSDLHRPLLAGKEQEYAAQVIASGHLSAGQWCDRFERSVCDFLGCRNAVAVVNATCGLHATFEALGWTGGKIAIPALTFVATANAVSHAGMIPRFVEHKDAQIPVDLLGHPSEARGLVRDAAQSLGSKKDGRYIGSRGTAVFSFNQNKILACIGGMVVTDNDDLARRIRHLVTTGRIGHKWLIEHDEIAFNYRLSDLHAAIGLAQMEQLPLILKAKRALAMKYRDTFRSIGVKFWDEPKGCESNFWLNAISVDQRDAILQALHDTGMMARCLFTPLHKLSPYKHNPRNDLSLTESLWEKTICLPSSPQIGLKYV